MSDTVEHVGAQRRSGSQRPRNAPNGGCSSTVNSAPRCPATSSTTSVRPPAGCSARTAAAGAADMDRAPSPRPGAPSTTPTGRPTARCASAAWNNSSRALEAETGRPA